ncbi:LacI family DNA-binding transcriptional regulator [Streptantibioticus silvisoli]|uniref:Substrate-binding domain-containing protein n=1 Tax=Streptantibioticus silvisoli TaxID=2705255 RepID=A0ABT6VTC1_9ACTN|nr:LacI family DNA-binding transcriptional regulator [Streptantibioticus silvisoli]MDI5961718.1 substrate-binding domain-containing protein [Streptantibioticus silvisoli]
MVRLSDVAARAGVSMGSASRVVNGHPGVRPEIRERVRTAARELGYRPDPLAQGLRARRSRLVTLVVPDITNPFFAELARELELDCAARGYQLVLRNSMESPATEYDALLSALDHRPSGIVVVPTAGTTALPATGDVPLVVCDRRLPGGAAPTVVSDNRQGASAATAYLMGLGHRRIACLAGPPGVHAADERLAGYLALTGGTPEGHGPVVRGPFDYATGQRAARELLDLDRPPTAILAGSDQQAIGVLHACLNRGLRVPDDISVCGFDAIALSALTSPALTTVRQPVRRIAARAMEFLLGPRPPDPAGFPAPAGADDCAGAGDSVGARDSAGARGSTGARDSTGAADSAGASDSAGARDSTVAGSSTRAADPSAPHSDVRNAPAPHPAEPDADLPHPAAPVLVSLPTELVVRASCAPPPEGTRTP